MYYLTFIYFVILVYIGEKFTKKTRFFLVSTPLIMIALLRFGVGADYFSYQKIYNQIDVSSINTLFISSTKIEPFFKLTMFLAKMLSVPYHFFAFAFSSFLILVNLKWIFENTERYEESVLLQYSFLFIYWSLSALRQGLVLVVLLYFFFNGKKNYSRSQLIGITIIMTLFHASALIVPIIYIISKLSWSKNKFIIMLLVAPLARLLFQPSFLQIFEWVPYVGKVLQYAEYDSIKLLSLPSLMRFSFAAIIIFHYDKISSRYENKVLLVNFSLVGLIGYFYLPLAMVVGTRTTIFSFALIVIIFPLIVSLYERTKFYSFAKISLVILTTISFLNEFSKLNDRTGFVGDNIALNFVTIFNGRREFFDTPASLDLRIDDINKERIENNKILEKFYTTYTEPEASFDSSKTHIPVMFSNGLYGVINEDSEVVSVPVHRYEPRVFGDIIEVTQNYLGFEWSRYFQIGTDHLTPKTGLIEYSYDDIKSKLSVDIEREMIVSGSNLYYAEVPKSEYSEYDFIKKNYSMQTFSDAHEYFYHWNINFNYLLLRNEGRNYVLIMKNRKTLVDNLYDSVIPLNKDGIIVGISKNGREYIDTEGNIIWVEDHK